MVKRILIIAPANSQLPNFSALASQLNLKGYTIEFAVNYVQAFSRLALVAGQRPDLMILAHQPGRGFDGLEIGRQLKSSVLLQSIPMMFYSFEDDLNTINKAYALGAGHYGVALKPPKDNLADFVQSIVQFMDLRTTAFYRMAFASPVCN